MKLACPNLEYTEIWEFINIYKWFFIIIMVIIGVIECFFGRRLLKITLFFTGFGSGAVFSSVYKKNKLKIKYNLIK